MKLNRAFILLLIFFLFIGCIGEPTPNKPNSPNNKMKDPFYSTNGGFDYAQIPLIKPYYLKALSGIETWDLYSYNKKHGSYIKSIEKFEITNNYIYGKSDSYTLFETTYPAKWFIFNFTDGTSKQFDTEKEYKQELEKNKIKPFELLSPNQHLENFRKSGKCHWFPAEEKK